MISMANYATTTKASNHTTTTTTTTTTNQLYVKKVLDRQKSPEQFIAIVNRNKQTPTRYMLY